jgi:FkbM family methyltransferase
MRINALLAKLHVAIADSDVGFYWAIKIRNQMEAIICYRLSKGHDLISSGEAAFLDHVGARIRVAIDVGSNVGDWFDALRKRAPMLKLGILVEPGKEAVAILRAKYGNSPNIHIVELAASDSIGSKEFYEIDNASEYSSLVRSPRITAARPKIFTVATSTIEHLILEKHLPVVDLLKIDAEGADMPVLRGCGSFLKERRINLIQFEYNSSWAECGETLWVALNMLRDAGYEVFLLNDGGLFDFDYDMIGDYFRYSNFVAVSPHANDWVAGLRRGPLERKCATTKSKR